MLEVLLTIGPRRLSFVLGPDDGGQKGALVDIANTRAPEELLNLFAPTATEPDQASLYEKQFTLIGFRIEVAVDWRNNRVRGEPRRPSSALQTGCRKSRPTASSPYARPPGPDRSVEVVRRSAW